MSVSTVSSIRIADLRGFSPLEHLKDLKGIKPDQFGSVLYKSEIEIKWGKVSSSPHLLDDFIFSMTHVFHSEITNGKKRSFRLNEYSANLATIESILYASKVMEEAHKKRSAHALDEDMVTAYAKFHQVFGGCFNAKVSFHENLQSFKLPDKHYLSTVMNSAREKNYINDAQLAQLNKKIRDSQDHIIILAKDIIYEILFEIPKLRQAYLENVFPPELEPQIPLATTGSVASNARTLFPDLFTGNTDGHRKSSLPRKSRTHSHRWKPSPATSQRFLFQ